MKIPRFLDKKDEQRRAASLPSPKMRRRARVFFACIAFVVFSTYVMPFINFFAQLKIMDIAYERHVAPQEGKKSVSINSRLLPRYKDKAIHEVLDYSKPSLMVVGNSTQFYFRREFLEKSYKCPVSNYYNMSYHSWDPIDLQMMLERHATRFTPGSTVLIAMYPEIFDLITRVNAPSINHPWNNTALWWRNMLDGNTSITTLYPQAINIEWPETWEGPLPIAQYYTGLWKFVQNGYSEEFVYRDGSVEFLGFEARTAERVARGEKLDFNRVVMALTAKSPLNENSLKSFAKIIRFLHARGVNVVAFETVFHPDYDKLRINPKRLSGYLDFMRRLSSDVPTFHYVPKSKTWIDIPDRLWLDNAHITFEGGRRLIEHYAKNAIDKRFICLDTNQ